MAFVSLKKRSALSSLVWSNLPKRTFSGLSFPRPPKPGFQVSASQAQASHSLAVVSLKKRSVLSSLVWSNLTKRTFSGYHFEGFQNQVFNLVLRRPQASHSRPLFLRCFFQETVSVKLTSLVQSPKTDVFKAALPKASKTRFQG